MKKLCDFLGALVCDRSIGSSVKSIRKDSVGKWKRDLGDEILRQIEPIISDTMKTYGYDRHAEVDSR